MEYSTDNRFINGCVSRVSIEYNDGHFEVREMNTAISKHACLQEAQSIKSMLDSEEA
jgi:hypothetical protein